MQNCGTVNKFLNNMYKTKINYSNLNYDFYIHDPEKDKVISKCIDLTGVWENKITDILLNNLSSNETFIDIGANIGWHTKVAEHIGCRVFAFEPEPTNFNLLQKNCNNKTTFLHNIGLSDICGNLFFQKNPINWGDIYVIDSGNIKSEVKTLDFFYDTLVYENIKIIKIDVQGHEMSIINGGKKLFNSLKPGTLVIVEVSTKSLKNNLINFKNFIEGFSKKYALSNQFGEIAFNRALRELLNNPDNSKYEFDLILTK
jgi:FkbM family methyltransferase